jgi:hypothetical protein
MRCSIMGHRLFYSPLAGEPKSAKRDWVGGQKTMFTNPHQIAFRNTLYFCRLFDSPARGELLLRQAVSIFILSITLIALLPTAAPAFTIQRPLESEKATYKLYYAGIPMGKLWLWWEADANYYKLSFSLKTTGVVRLFNKQRRMAEITGKRVGDVFTPIHYHASVIYPHKQKSTDMSYEQGSLRDIVNEPPEPLNLTEVQKISAVDPMSGLLQLFTYMGSGAHTTPFATVYYDGKRLSRGYAVPSADAVPQCAASCMAYRLHRTPLAGFDADEMEDYGKGEPPLLVAFIPNARFPLFASAHALLGTVTMLRVKE